MEINEKKTIYNEKRFFFGVEILKGYCPVCIVTERLGSRRAQGSWGAGERAGVRAGRVWGAQVAAGRWASGRAASARDVRGARQERQADTGQGRGRGATGATSAWQERQARARQADTGQGRCRGAAAARRAHRARGPSRQRAAGAQAGTAWARRGARLGALCARGTTGLGVAWALDG